MSNVFNQTTTLLEQTILKFEIVGLHHNSQGRSCTMHSHCGKHVLEGDILQLVRVVIQIRDDKEPEEAISLVKIIDGTEGCVVAFVP
jgi:hypothetical protein